MTTLHAILFDLDGTLADTLEDLATAGNLALAGLGLPPEPLEAYRRHVGSGLQALAERALRAAGAPVEEDQLRQFIQRFREHYDRHQFDHTRPYPGIPEMLTHLRTRDPALAVLSNKPHEYTVGMVEHLFPGFPFREVWGHRPEYPRKPSPKSALAILERLGVAPGEAAMVGDTSVDMETARATGMLGVGVLWGFRDRAELVASGADRLCATVGELLGHLGQK